RRRRPRGDRRPRGAAADRCARAACDPRRSARSDHVRGAVERRGRPGRRDQGCRARERGSDDRAARGSTHREVGVALSPADGGAPMVLAFLAAVGALALLTVLPGPDFAVVVRWAAVRGRRSGVLASWGVAAGLLVWGALTVLGLSALLAASPITY